MSWKEKKEILGKEIIEMLYDSQMIRTWYDKPEGWTLHSGLWSPVYINLRHLGSYPAVFKKVGSAMGQLIKEECKSVNKVVGIATAGVPIAAAVGIDASLPCGYTRKIEGVSNVDEFRKKITQYGQHAIVEGFFENGDEIVLIDDLVTRMTSKLIAIEQFRAEMKRRNVNAISNKILVLLDREQGAKKTAEENGLELFSLIPFKTKGVKWLKDRFTSLEYEIISDYLLNSDKYQSDSIQKDLKNQAINK